MSIPLRIPTELKGKCMQKKYEFTGETKEHYGITLRQIRLLIDLPYFKKGSIGGWIEKEFNLAHEGNCWVSGNSRVYGNSRVFGNSMVSENSKVYGDSRVFGNSRVFENSCVSGNSLVSGNSRVSGNSIVENVEIEHISRNGYNINYSGVDRDSKEHLVRVGCQLHSISTWKDKNTRKEIMRNNNFPKSYEQEFLRILNEIEGKYGKTTIQKIEENVQKLKIQVTEPLKVETVSLVNSLQVSSNKSGPQRDKFGRFMKKNP